MVGQLCCCLLQTPVSLCLQRRQGALCAGSLKSAHLIPENTSPPHTGADSRQAGGDRCYLQIVSPEEDAGQVNLQPALNEASLVLSLERTMPAHLQGPKPSSRHPPTHHLSLPLYSLPGLGPANNSFPADSHGFVPVSHAASGRGRPQEDVPSTLGRELTAFSSDLFCREPVSSISSKGKPSHV